jgi:hypothetical protein
MFTNDEVQRFTKRNVTTTDITMKGQDSYGEKSRVEEQWLITRKGRENITESPLHREGLLLDQESFEDRARWIHLIGDHYDLWRGKSMARLLDIVLHPTWTWLL